MDKKLTPPSFGRKVTGFLSSLLFVVLALLWAYQLINLFGTVTHHWQGNFISVAIDNAIEGFLTFIFVGYVFPAVEYLVKLLWAAATSALVFFGMEQIDAAMTSKLTAAILAQCALFYFLYRLRPWRKRAPK